MRKIASFLILLGVGLAVLLPWIQSNFAGNEIVSLPVYDREDGGWRTGIVKISPDDNPVRIRIDAKYLVDAKLPPNGLPITIRVSGADGVVLDGTISISTSLKGSAPEQEKMVSTSAPLFAIADSGDYLIEVGLASNATQSGILDPGLSSVRAALIRNAVEADNRYQMPGVILAIFGVYLMMRSRRRKPPTAGANKSPATKSRWGRGKK